jgi:hypothetical protein
MGTGGSAVSKMRAAFWVRDSGRGGLDVGFIVSLVIYQQTDHAERAVVGVDGLRAAFTGIPHGIAASGLKQGLRGGHRRVSLCGVGRIFGQGPGARVSPG